MNNLYGFVQILALDCCIRLNHLHNFFSLLIVLTMGGGLMQLVAYGAQDVYLTGNPVITFFKVVYRRHTNFAMESIQQTFNGTPNWGSRVSATISRNGDLITNTYLQVTIGAFKINDVDATGYDESSEDTIINTTSIGHSLIKTIELEIGGQRIDKHYGDWLEIWSELTVPQEKLIGFNTMIGKRIIGSGDNVLTGATHTAETTYYIPLQFFFCRNPGLALPLIALQYHEVKINVEFNDSSNTITLGHEDILPQGGSTVTVTNHTAPTFDCSLYVDYIYLDTDERRRFAQVSHEMLIEQLQFTGDESITSQNLKYRMNFNHPVKELVWVFSGAGAPFGRYEIDDDSESAGAISYDGDGTSIVDPITKAKIMLNGHDRMSERAGSYFRYVQPYQHHTRVPTKPIYVYSFALRPEEHQPSGTCNFSRIDNAQLSIQCEYPWEDGSTIKVYATNYNVLRIMSGMAGLAFSN